jgi:hypothetical protein
MAGTLPKSPGMSYWDMYRLIVINRIQMFKDVFTPELILGICWEETFFNNVKQTVGTAVGFGQTEPSNFWILESVGARANGYFVSGLPRRQTLKKGKDEITILLGSLSDEQSVQVVSGFLCHLYLDAKRDVSSALQNYAGMSFSRKIAGEVARKEITAADAVKIDPLGVAGRQAKIDGWRRCEDILLRQLPAVGDGRPKIREALAASRGFPKEDAAWNKILFPEPDTFWG